MHLLNVEGGAAEWQNSRQGLALPGLGEPGRQVAVYTTVITPADEKE